LRGLARSKKIFVVILLFILAFSWLSLYLSSFYQRRKAEHLIAELRTFPFATAGFAEVRDFVLRHGGMAKPEPSQAPPFGCTAQGCMFQIWLGRPFSQPPTNQQVWQSLYPTLPYVGLRPWNVYVQLEVRNGVLMRSTTIVGQLRRGDMGTFGLLTIEYSIHTERSSTPYSRSGDRTDDYLVLTPHVTGPPTKALSSWVVQSSDAPMNRVFDVDLRCLTTIFRGCSDPSALAPSAWQHYRARLETP